MGVVPESGTDTETETETEIWNLEFGIRKLDSEVEPNLRFLFELELDFE